jgi:uncharacterized protein YjbJ (UPF0337 family)
MSRKHPPSQASISSGKAKEIAGALQQRYGYGRAQAEMEIKN